MANTNVSGPFRPLPFPLDFTNFFGGGELKVTPQQLLEHAEKVSSDVTSINNSFDRLERIVSATGTYWNGDAAEAFRQAYVSFKDEIEEIILRITEHVADLKTMAGVYTQTEQAVQTVATSLPDEVIL